MHQDMQIDWVGFRYVTWTPIPKPIDDPTDLWERGKEVGKLV